MRQIRPFDPTPAEYEAIVALNKEIWPDERHFSVTAWQQNDDEWPTTALNQRFMLVDGTRIVGMASCLEKYWQHQDGTVHVEVHVLPLADRQQAEAQLFEHVVAFLQARPQPPTILATEAREDQAERLAYLRAQGFEEKLRTPRAYLDVAQANVDELEQISAEIAAAGILIQSLAELQPTVADWAERLHALRWAIVQDVPAVEPPTPISFEAFEQMILDDPAFDPRAWWIALDERADAAWIGLSNLWLNDPTHRRLDTGLTGVLAAYRRRGIAKALKLHAIRLAKALGAATIETDNEENNPMFGLNMQLGYRPRAAWLSFRRPFARG